MIQIATDLLPSREQKRLALAGLLEDRPRPTEFVLRCTYHGVGVKFYFESESLMLKMKSFLPASWQYPDLAFEKAAMEVFWLHPKNFFSSNSWQEDENPDCEITFSHQGELAIQRDFIGLLDVRGYAVIVAQQEMGDGIFNALRWLLPRRMIQFKNILLHSSCVVGHNGLAYFFLGPSGAGKTTVTEMAEGRLVLGDDMNVLNWGPDGMQAEAGALGQRYSNAPMFSKQFPVGGFFWLRQSSNNFLNRNKTSKSSMRLLRSCANLFWKENSPDLAQEVLSMIHKISLVHPVHELEFNLDGGFWKYVDSN